jgi:hypothetical protein
VECHQTTPRLQVDVGGTTDLEFKLPVAGAKETVTVSGEPPLVETQPSGVSSMIDERAINELPLNGRRYTDEVVQEFRVSSNTYGAELGRSGGAVVNVVTKSGSNHLHGTDFYFIRDSAFGATHPLLDFKPHHQQQQFGFTLGGPIRRNKIFFFAGLDQHIFHVPTVVRFDSGSSVVVPQPGTGPETPGDYEAADKALVFAKAAKLSKQAGTFPTSMLGNAGFVKLDVSLTPRNNFSARVNTSRYYGHNNVFLDPASPLTTFGISENGEEDVTAETASVALTSNLSGKAVSHLRAQFSRDLQRSSSNSSAPITRIPNIIDGFGRSSILPRETREHRLHLAETFSIEGKRNSWKLGGDALLTRIYNFFPSLSGGEYIFDPIKVNQFTFQPQESGLELTPLRAYAHGVPHYYVQNFGPAVTHPDTNEYAGFLQDTIRVTDHLALSLGARYDLQTFSTNGLVSNPLWPDSGKVPFNPNNFGPRGGLAYSIGNVRPLVIRAGYGLFYTRIPQIYNSTVESQNGLAPNFLFLNNNHFYDHQIFPQYPNPLVSCSLYATVCLPPASLEQFTQSGISAFAHNFKTPRVQQASLNLEREVAHRLAVGVSYTYVHGVDLIRARDVNLPPPVNAAYPVYDASGADFLGSYHNVASFSTWQLSESLTCPFPPCINPLARPIPQLGAINVFESEASSVYHGATLSIRRRMTSGVYFMLSYTFAHALDDGQDALVAGRPATVQNSYAPNSEKGPSVTDQRHRFAFSWVAEPKPFHRSHELLGALFNNWKLSGVVTMGSGRPVSATVTGDPNQDGNSSNDRLPGTRRNSFLGPDYATTDALLTRRLYMGDRFKLELAGESFNLLNRDNRRVVITEDGFINNSARFIETTKQLGINYFPAHYQVPRNPVRASDDLRSATGATRFETDFLRLD